MKRLIAVLALVASAATASYFRFNSFARVNGYAYPPADDWGAVGVSMPAEKSYSLTANPGVIALETGEPDGCTDVSLYGDVHFSLLGDDSCPGTQACTVTVTFQSDTPGDYTASLQVWAHTGGAYIGWPASQKITVHVQ